MRRNLGRPRAVVWSFSFAALQLLGCGPSQELGSSEALETGGSLEFGRSREIYERATKLRVGGVRHLLPTPTGAALAVTVENFDLEDGRIAMNGHAEGVPSARFVLKGERDDLSGFLAYREQRVAYEYKTVNGAFVVEQVPFERIYPVCNLERAPRAPEDVAEAEPPVEAAPSGGESWIGTYNNSDLRKLQSRPGAKKVIYLNITDAMNGDTPKDFSKEEMWKSWAGIAAAYSAWDVNVTTDPAVYTAAGVANSGVADFKSTDDRAYCALGAFGTREACQVFTGDGAEPEKGYGVSRSGAHELGHLLGLDHDGSASEEYFPGIQAFNWAPLMGNYYSHSGNEALNQWSKGEYSGANQKQDDLAIITKSLPYREDDIPSTKALTINGSAVTSDVNRGQIAKNTDLDTFTFKIGSSGHATLNIDRIEYIGGSMLDVDARIVNGSGTEVGASNPKAGRGAKFDMDLPAGDYTLVIKGAAEGTPQNGFSNYSSLGYYGIKGTVTGAVTGGGGTGTGGSGTGGTGTGGASAGGSGGAGAGAGGKGGSGGTGGMGGTVGTTGGNAGAAAGGAAGAAQGGSSGAAGAANRGGAAGASAGGSSGAGGTSGNGGAPVAGSAGAPAGGAVTTSGGAPTTSGGAPTTSGGAVTTSGGALTTSGGAPVTSGGATTSGGKASAGAAGATPTPPAEDGCACSTVGARNSQAPLGLLVSALAGVVALGRRRRRTRERD